MKKNNKYIICGSSSWVKGMDDAVEYCKTHDLEYEIVWGIPYDEMLEKFAQSKGFVFLPKGADTCPRQVIEAKMLGCDVIINDNVQHAKEVWFDTSDELLRDSYLYAARERFWNGIRHDMGHRPTLSGYTTTRNCVAQDYPFEACIKSMLGFCDEVCVVDGGSTDGTLFRLFELAAELAEPGELSPEFVTDMRASHRRGDDQASMGLSELDTKRLKVKVIRRDWEHPRFALFDGMQKAEARSLCTGDFCWQMDSDEVLHERDFEKVRKLVDEFPKECDMMALPVVEFWGGKDKVRCDVNAWKWRLSRNVPNITHGVPKDQRRFDSEGRLYSAGSDGCDPIDAATHEPIPFLTFITPDVDALRQRAVTQEDARGRYEKWLAGAVDALPSVLHFSWWDIARKMRTYRDYWTRHWRSISNQSLDDTAETNMMFDLPWSQVSDEMIELRARELATSTSGWIWHRKWDGTETLGLKLDVGIPDSMREWTERNGMR